MRDPKDDKIDELKAVILKAEIKISELEREIIHLNRELLDQSLAILVDRRIEGE